MSEIPELVDRIITPPEPEENSLPPVLQCDICGVTENAHNEPFKSELSVQYHKNKTHGLHKKSTRKKRQKRFQLYNQANEVKPQVIRKAERRVRFCPECGSNIEITERALEIAYESSH